MGRMDVVFRQMYDSTALLRYRELEFSRAVRLFYTPIVFGVCHRRPRSRQVRHWLRTR